MKFALRRSELLCLDPVDLLRIQFLLFWHLLLLVHQAVMTTQTGPPGTSSLFLIGLPSYVSCWQLLFRNAQRKAPSLPIEKNA